MSIITVFNGIFCNQEAIIQELLNRTGYKLMTDTNIVAKAGRHSGLSESKISRAFSGKPSVFNAFTHEKERAMAYLSGPMTGAAWWSARTKPTDCLMSRASHSRAGCCRPKSATSWSGR